MAQTTQSTSVQCFHCGEDCITRPIRIEEKAFCCEGCRMVYELLNKEGLCNYYALNTAPGVNRRQQVRADKFAFLEQENIQQQLIDFRDDEQTQVLFYLPQIHCSSCLWLLENLFRLHEGVISCSVDYTRKEARVTFNHHKAGLREVAELLTGIGYEPYISLNNLKAARPAVSRRMTYQLGVAGFCFANIMLMSFPEYLGIDKQDAFLGNSFRYLNLLLALPVFFYSASGFYSSAWKSLRKKYLNIDAPIALAIIVTFVRSVYEVISGTGSGYFDSMSGIVFFMLAGRVLQDRTYRQLSFDRDYTSYFPVSVTVTKDDKEEVRSLPEIQLNDTLLIHHQELIPADGILTRGKALIDYSFVTGESAPVEKEMGEIVYAGGKQVGGNIEILVIREVTQSYLTRLWNDEKVKKEEKQTSSYVEKISKYFTWVVLAIAASAGVFWSVYDPARVWDAVTAVLIIACPCALLLCHTFTNGNILRIFGRNRFYLRNATAIEAIAATDLIVFDKTGTLTTAQYQQISYDGTYLCEKTKQRITALAAQSTHPLSRSIVQYLKTPSQRFIQGFREQTGHGIEGIVEGDLVSIGSRSFVTGTRSDEASSAIYVAIENKLLGKFTFTNQYRENVPELLRAMQQQFKVAVLSGDNEGEKAYLESVLGKDAVIRFRQQPQDKLNFIETAVAEGKKVMMVGDGLNDAGALKASTVGIAVAEDANQFTPASDGILDAKELPSLLAFIKMAKAAERIIIIAFVVSLLYNLIGLSFAVRGSLNPMIAAILMPASSLTIFLMTYGFSSLLSYRFTSQASKPDKYHIV